MMESTETEEEVSFIPDSYLMTLWRNILSMTYMHPTLLVHPDMAALRAVFIENNIIHRTPDVEIVIPFPEPDEPVHSLRPHILYPETPVQVIFGEVKSCSISTKGIIISDFSLCSAARDAVEEMAKFIRNYPQRLFDDSYGFIYDFLIRFGMKPCLIDRLVESASNAVTPTILLSDDVLPFSESPPLESPVNLETEKKTQVRKDEKGTKRKSSNVSTAEHPPVKSICLRDKPVSQVGTVEKRPRKSLQTMKKVTKESEQAVQKNVRMADANLIPSSKANDLVSCVQAPSIVIPKLSLSNIEVAQECQEAVEIEPKPETRSGNSQVQQTKSEEPNPTSATLPKEKETNSRTRKSGSVVLVVVEKLRGALPPPKFLGKHDLSKFKLKTLSVTLHDCLRDPVICSKYFKKSEPHTQEVDFIGVTRKPRRREKSKQDVPKSEKGVISSASSSSTSTPSISSPHIKTPLPNPPVATSTHLPQELRNDCSPQFMQRLFLALDQVQTSDEEDQPLKNGFPSDQISPVRTSSHPAKVERKGKMLKPKVIVQPVNGSAKIPHALFRQDLSRSRSTSPIPSSPSPSSSSGSALL